MKSRKCKVVWDHSQDGDSQVEKIILSNGEEVIPKESVSSWETLDNFLKKNYPEELTWWGKFAWFMNQ